VTIEGKGDKKEALPQNVSQTLGGGRGMTGTTIHVFGRRKRISRATIALKKEEQGLKGKKDGGCGHYILLLEEKERVRGIP